MLVDCFVTEARTFVGENASYPGSGYAGYVVGTTYPVRFARQPDGTVLVEGVREAAGELVIVGASLFERWWVA